MRTVSAWILMLSVCEIYAAETVDIYQKQSYVSAKPGEAVTLQCTLADRQSTEDVFWYKQPVGQMPQEERDAMELYYSTFSEADTKRGKKKKRRWPQDDVCSEVIYSS
ncbi:hypothetical protein SRHO_G00125120 [Serrasalmus rhombeus]